MKKKQALVFGYWRNNFGDDLMLSAFKELKSDTELIIAVDRKFSRYYKHLDVHVFSYGYLFRIINKVLIKLGFPGLFYLLFANKARDFYVVGGSLFMENDAWKQQYRSMSYSVKHCDKSFVVSSNFGPYQSNDFLDAYKQFFRVFDRVVIRDKSSLGMFSELGNVVYKPDIVLTLDDRVDVEKTNSVTVAAINLDNRKELVHFREAYERRLRDMISEFSIAGRKVCLFSFCEYEGDEMAAQRIYQALPQDVSKNVVLYVHKFNEESLQTIKKSSLIIASRFHALVLAMKYRIPFYIISYSDKIDNVIHDFGYEKYSSRIQEFVKTELSFSDLLVVEDSRDFFDFTMLKDQYKEILNENSVDER